jgi:hypothetical protein
MMEVLPYFRPPALWSAGGGAPRAERGGPVIWPKQSHRYQSNETATPIHRHGGVLLWLQYL